MNGLAKSELEELAMTLAPGTGPRLEARLARAEAGPLGVLCHPHPLFGGTMDNRIVVLLRRVLWELGLGTLRFNFRGVGQSEGSYGGGGGEADDLRAVLDLTERGDHASDGVILGGYSFGAWAAAMVCSQAFVPRALLLVSPPVDFLSFSGLELPDVPCLIAVGAQDELCSRTGLQAWLRSLAAREVAPTVQIVPDADHYWTVGIEALREALLRFFGGTLGPRPG